MIRTGSYASSSMVGGLFGERDFSGATLKEDAASRPIYVCPDGRIFITKLEIRSTCCRMIEFE